MWPWPKITRQICAKIWIWRVLRVLSDFTLHWSGKMISSFKLISNYFFSKSRDGSEQRLFVQKRYFQTESAHKTVWNRRGADWCFSFQEFCAGDSLPWFHKITIFSNLKVRKTRFSKNPLWKTRMSSLIRNRRKNFFSVAEPDIQARMDSRRKIGENSQLSEI